MFSILISSQTFTELFDPCHQQLTNTLRHVFINIYQYCFLTHKTCDIRQKHVANTSGSFPHSRLITGFVTRLTRRVPLVEQELPTLPEHLNTPTIFSGFVLLDLQFYMYFLQIVVCPFVLFLLAIVLSVLLRYTDSDYPFGIFKLFLHSFTSPTSRALLHGTPYLIFHERLMLEGCTTHEF